MADLHDDDHLFEDMSPESPGTIGRNIVRRLGLASRWQRPSDLLIKTCMKDKSLKYYSLEILYNDGVLIPEHSLVMNWQSWRIDHERPFLQIRSHDR